MDLWLIGGIAVMSFVLGVIAHQIWVKIVVWHTLREMQRNGIDLEELFSDEESEQVNRNVECRLEQHDGVWILYRKDNNEFVAQGRNKQELSDAVEKRYPGQSVVATEFADDIKERFQTSTD